MKFIENKIKTFDKFQQKHPLLGFPIAVIKKYGDDESGRQAALITYYGFWSLFPLLLVLTTILQIMLSHDPELRVRIINGATTYFPIAGTHLRESIHGLHKTGPALIISVLLTLYGARGVADAFRHSVNDVWPVPKDERSAFPVSLLKNLAIIVVGGVGMVAVSFIAGYVIGIGHGLGFAVAGILLSMAMLFGLFTLLIKISLPMHTNIKLIWPGAAFIAVGIVILQSTGGYILTHELKNLDNLYGTFALVLGLIFWIFLQAQVVLYALEIDSVRARKMWPRKLIGE